MAQPRACSSRDSRPATVAFASRLPLPAVERTSPVPRRGYDLAPAAEEVRQKSADTPMRPGSARAEKFRRNVLAQLQYDVKRELLRSFDCTNNTQSAGPAATVSAVQNVSAKTHRSVLGTGACAPVASPDLPMAPRPVSCPIPRKFSTALAQQQWQASEIVASANVPAVLAAPVSHPALVGRKSAAPAWSSGAVAIPYCCPESPIPPEDLGVPGRSSPCCGVESPSSLERDSPWPIDAEEDFEVVAEREALDQTLMPHYALIGAEKDILENALHLARVDVQRDEVVVRVEANNRTSDIAIHEERRDSQIPKTPGHGQALMSFVAITLRRCIRRGLVHQDQWKVLLESPGNSWYEPVLSRFRAAVVFADASGFTHLTESLACQPRGAEKIGATLNGFFGPLIDLVRKHGGDVIKFSGDAVTIAWVSEEPAPDWRRPVTAPKNFDTRRTSVSVPNSRRVSYASGSVTNSRRCSTAKGIDSRRTSSAEPGIVSFNLSARLASKSSLLSSPPGVDDHHGTVRILEPNTASHSDSDEDDDEDESDSEETELDMSPEEADKLAMSAAARFCIEVQEQICKFGKTDVPGCTMAMHIGVGFGDLALLQVGGLLGRWEYCVAGKALDQIAIAVPLASPGESVFSPEARAICGNAFVFEDVVGAEAANDEETEKLMTPFGKLVALSDGDVPEEDSPHALPWWSDIRDGNVDLRLLKRYVPSAIAMRLACSPKAESVTYPEEMRRVSVIFLTISGLDPSEDTARSDRPGRLCGSRRAQLLIRLMQRSVYALEGSVNKFLVDDKGVLLLVVFGLPPLIHFTDDPIRAVLCGMRLVDTLKDEGLQGCAGIATGQCWCGVIGTEKRREYSVLGDTVNLAARLMGHAPTNKVLVDAVTYEAACDVVDFMEIGELQLKGKKEPVRAFRFVQTRKGVARHKAPLGGLLSWPGWPAHLSVLRALDANARRSGVLVVRGPGGAGKMELAEAVRGWTAAHRWTLLAGQNMDPSGIFTVARASLQEAFRQLVHLASKDSHWRTQAWDLLLASLGEGRTNFDWQLAQTSQRRGSRRGPPAHAELYWMLVAMLRSSVGLEASVDLEPWAPLLSLVVNQLAFAPRMVSAMAERDEQHSRRNSRFAELCAGVLDAFSTHGSPTGGTVALLHVRRSSAFFQSDDPQQRQAINAMAELCMRRRSAFAGSAEGERRPLLLVVLAREISSNAAPVLESARACDGLVDAEDLDIEGTTAYVRHLLRQHREAVSQTTEDCARCQGQDFMATRGREACDVARADDRVAVQTEAGAAAVGGEADSWAIIADYVYEMTGGNPLCVQNVMLELIHQKVLHLDPKDPELLTLDKGMDAARLRTEVPVPESLVGMAFSTFEQLTPQQQMVLKAASTFDGSFGLRELSAALPAIDPEEIRVICRKLADRKMRTLRRMQAGDGTLSSSTLERRSVLRLMVSARGSKADGPEDPRPDERFQFYSGVLRHAASTLVLEVQRTEVQRRASSVHLLGPQ